MQILSVRSHTCRYMWKPSPSLACGHRWLPYRIEDTTRAKKNAFCMHVCVLVKYGTDRSLKDLWPVRFRLRWVFFWLATRGRDAKYPDSTKQAAICICVGFAQVSVRVTTQPARWHAVTWYCLLRVISQTVTAYIWRHSAPQSPTEQQVAEVGATRVKETWRGGRNEGGIYSGG